MRCLIWLFILVSAVAAAQTTPPAKPPAPVSPPAAAPTPGLPPAATPAPGSTPALTPAQQRRMAMEKQRLSIRKQAEAVGVTMMPWSDPVSGGASDPTACEPMADAAVAPLIEAAAKTNELQVKLVRAVIEQESGFRPCAVSPKGAMGIMQLMPDTADELGLKEPFDARQNIEAGTKYLKQMLDKYKGDTTRALAAYNAGPAAVDAVDGIPDNPETREYVDNILRKMQ